MTIILQTNLVEEESSHAQREVGPAIWLRNVERNQDQHSKITNVHQQMPEKHPQNQVVRSCLKRRAVEQGEVDPHRDGDQKAQMGLNRPHTMKACIQHHKASHHLNPQGKLRVGRPKQTWRRSTDHEIKAAGITWVELKRTS